MDKKGLLFTLLLIIVLLNACDSSLESVTGKVVEVDSCGDVTQDIILTSDLTATGDCLIIKADNVVIDGNGHKILSEATSYMMDGMQPIGPIGVLVNGYDNVTIKNFVDIRGFYNGIRLENSEGCTVENNIIVSDKGVDYKKEQTSIIIVRGANNLKADNHRIISNSLYTTPNWGRTIIVIDGANNTFSGNKITEIYSSGTSLDGYEYLSMGNVFENMEFGNNVVISSNNMYLAKFAEYDSEAFGNPLLPEMLDKINVGGYVEVSSWINNPGYVDFNIHYENEDVEFIDENTITLYRYDESQNDWVVLSGSSVDTDLNKINSGLIQFSENFNDWNYHKVYLAAFGDIDSGTCGNNVCDYVESCFTCADDCGECECTDTDNGSRFFVKGTTSVNNNEPLDGNHHDYCYYDELTEYYCTDEERLGSAKYDCPSGCENGACLRTGPSSVACPSIPCYFGPIGINGTARWGPDYGTWDIPPRTVSAGYPYQFNVEETTYLDLSLTFLMSIGQGGQYNIMYVYVDGEELHSEKIESREGWPNYVSCCGGDSIIRDKNINLSLQNIEPGEHLIEVFAWPLESHFSISELSLEESVEEQEDNCGNNICQLGETCSNCQQDCGECFTCSDDAFFCEDFNDGDYTNDPEWELYNGAVSVIGGALHSDGLITEENDVRWRSTMRYFINFSTVDKVEFSYKALLKSEGNPQEGRGVGLAIPDLNLNENAEYGGRDRYDLRIINGYTSGFPIDDKSLHLGYCDYMKCDDWVKTSFVPERDRWYTLKAIRQEGIWSFYVDDVLIDTYEEDPFNITDFFLLYLFTTGSVIIDDIVVDVEPPVDDCTDTDDGINYYVKGKVTIDDSYHYDTCYEEELVEYYCKEDNSLGLIGFECQFGCEEGACLEEACTDDDCEEPPADGGTPGSGELPPPNVPPEQEDLCPAHLILICHQAESGELAICVSPDSIPYHLSHDDYLGECVNEKRYKYFVEEIKPHIPVEIPVNLENASIEHITIEVSEEFTRVEIIFRTREVPPQDVPKHERPVLKYIVIEHPGIEEEKLEKATLNFKVEKEWVKKHTKNVNNVLLTKFVDDKWEDLPTKYIEEDNDNYYFEADSDGLSVFAVTVKPDIGSSEFVEQEPDTEAGEPEPLTTEDKELALDNTMIITIVVISILAVGLFTFIIEHKLKKRHSQPKNQDHLKKLEIINYVRECREKGFSDETIKKKLIEEKHDSRFIDDCLNTNYKNIK